MKKNREFIIGLIFIIAVAVMVGIWIDSREKTTTYTIPKTNIETSSKEVELDTIMKTSESTDLEDLEADLEMEINIDELENL